MDETDAGLWTGGVVLTTERLTLRLFLASDLPQYAALNADPEVMAHLGGPLSEAQSDAIARGAQRAFLRSGLGKLAVERRADGAFLGMSGLSVEPWYPNEVEIGWRLARRYWGLGYATEAGGAWLDYGFSRLGLDRVISITEEANARSRSSIGRLGLQLDHRATLKEGQSSFEAMIFAISSERWRASNPGLRANSQRS